MSVMATETVDSSKIFRVLVVADQRGTTASLSSRLAHEPAYEVLSASKMEAGLEKAQVEWPSLVILDLAKRDEMFYLCETLKSDHGTSQIPIIMISAANEIADRIAGLEAGVADYIGKPCNSRELALRVKAVLRRGTRATAEEQLVRGPIQVDPARCRVTVENKQIKLTAVEFKLLWSMARQTGEVQSREALLTDARGNGEAQLESRTIDTHIRRLRRKLGKAAHLVETVRGLGYRLRQI